MSEEYYSYLRVLPESLSQKDQDNWGRGDFPKSYSELPLIALIFFSDVVVEGEKARNLDEIVFVPKDFSNPAHYVIRIRIDA